MIPGFVKILHLGDKSTNGIWDGDIEVTEKIDGSQFNFGNIEGRLQMRSKNVEYFHGANPMFNPVGKFAQDGFDASLLPDGLIFHGETLSKPQHNTLKYNRVPKNSFMLYGMSTLNDGKQVYYSDYALLREWADTLNCEVVPLLFRGRGNDFLEKYPDIKVFIDAESFLGGPKMEGIVVKNYSKPVWVAERLFPILCGKYVSTAFKEKHIEGWKHSNPSALEQIGNAFKSEARWSKAIQHLQEQSKLTNTPKDIGPLLGEIVRDLEEEERENIKDALWRLFNKDVKRVATGGFPEWYKMKLLEDSVNATSES